MRRIAALSSLLMTRTKATSAASLALTVSVEARSWAQITKRIK
jgi:hypothetical protein